MSGIVIRCQCEQRLGLIGPSIRSGNPRPVWKIEPGWSWSDSHLGRGILERRDDSFLSERRLSHELVGRQRPPQGMGLARECDLPIVVRCPKCSKLRWVAPDAVLVSAGSPGYRRF